MKKQVILLMLAAFFGLLGGCASPTDPGSPITDGFGAFVISSNPVTASVYWNFNDETKGASVNGADALSPVNVSISANTKDTLSGWALYNFPTVFSGTVTLQVVLTKDLQQVAIVSAPATCCSAVRLDIKYP